MLEKDLSHTFTHSVKKRFMELGFPSSTSGELSELISPVKIDSTEKKVLSRCDNFFYLEQIIKPYHEEIHDIVQKCWGHDFIFEIDNTFKGETGVYVANTPQNLALETQIEPPAKPKEAPIKQEVSSVFLNSLNFNSIISCSYNQKAIKACQYIISDKTHISEPIVLFGPTGLGKTHLLQATGQAFQKANKNSSIAYLSGHEFINDVIHKGIRLGKMEEIRNKYKTCDLLLVDDFDALEKKSVCQIEFLYILNSILQQKKRVIITAQKPLKNFTHILPQLKSRIAQGVLVEITHPTLSDRIKILETKSYLRKLNLSDFQLECIAEAVQDNIRELDGVLNDILFQNEINDENNLTDVIYKRIKPNIDTKKQRIDYLQKVVCEIFSIDLATLKSTNRKTDIAFARHIAIYVAKSFLKIKTSEIASAFNRNHPKIVLYSLKKISHLLSNDLETKVYLDKILEKIR